MHFEIAPLHRLQAIGAPDQNPLARGLVGPAEEEAGYQILCECGDTDCTEQLAIAPPQYEQVRSDPALFIVARGHIAPDVEGVTADRGAYQIVRKRPGAPENIAEATDPRDS